MPLFVSQSTKKTGFLFYMEKDLKKQAEITDLFVKYADKIEIDDKDVPKTEKGMATKAKELIEKLDRKIKKVSEDEMNVFSLKKKRLLQETEKESSKKERE
jgi:hypothetical protein